MISWRSPLNVQIKQPQTHRGQWIVQNCYIGRYVASKLRALNTRESKWVMGQTSNSKYTLNAAQLEAGVTFHSPPWICYTNHVWSSSLPLAHPHTSLNPNTKQSPIPEVLCHSNMIYLLFDLGIGSSQIY